MPESLPGRASRFIVDVRPGPDTESYCDGKPGELPVLVVWDGAGELLITPNDQPTAVDLRFAEAHQLAATRYLAAVLRMVDQ